MSTLKFNKWERIDGTPVGSIIQVKHTLYTTPTSQAMTAGVEVPITGITLDITPYSSNSRMLIMARWTGEFGFNAHDGVFFILRNGTKINVQTSTGLRASGSVTPLANYAASSALDNNSTPDAAYITTIDSPNTTSQITYSMGCGFTNTNTLYTNRTIGTTDSYNFERTTSEIIVMEIAS